MIILCETAPSGAIDSSRLMWHQSHRLPWYYGRTWELCFTRYSKTHTYCTCRRDNDTIVRWTYANVCFYSRTAAWKERTSPDGRLPYLHHLHNWQPDKTISIVGNIYWTSRHTLDRRSRDGRELRSWLTFTWNNSYVGHIRTSTFPTLDLSGHTYDSRNRSQHGSPTMYQFGKREGSEWLTWWHQPGQGSSWCVGRRHRPSTIPFKPRARIDDSAREGMAKY